MIGRRGRNGGREEWNGTRRKGIGTKRISKEGERNKNEKNVER